MYSREGVFIFSYATFKYKDLWYKSQKNIPGYSDRRKDTTSILTMIIHLL